MTQPGPVTINIPPVATGAVQIFVVHAGSAQETQSAFSPISSTKGELGAGGEGGGGVAPASIPAQNAGSLTLAADPCCRCQISRSPVRDGFASRIRLRRGMKWASRMVAVLEGYSAVRDSMVPVAMAAAATLHFV
jgi:hypothetical protein